MELYTQPQKRIPQAPSSDYSVILRLPLIVGICSSRQNTMAHIIEHVNSDPETFSWTRYARSAGSTLASP